MHLLQVQNDRAASENTIIFKLTAAACGSSSVTVAHAGDHFYRLDEVSSGLPAAAHDLCALCDHSAATRPMHDVAGVACGTFAQKSNLRFLYHCDRLSEARASLLKLYIHNSATPDTLGPVSQADSAVGSEESARKVSRER